MPLVACVLRHRNERRGQMHAALAFLLVLQTISALAADGPIPHAGTLDELLGPAEKSIPDANRSAVTESQQAVRRGPPGPVPDADASLAAQQKVRDAFAADIKAARDLSSWRKLVGQLVEIADDQAVNAAERHAALEVALREASLGEDPQLVLEVLRVRAAWFVGQDCFDPMVLYLDAAVKKNIGDPSAMLAAALQTNRDALEAGSPKAAKDSVELAALLLPRGRADDADRFRPELQRQQASTAEMLKVFDDADAAAKTLTESPEDPIAQVRVGFRAVWCRDWATAIKHFKVGWNKLLRDAAENESALREEATASELSDAAAKWWVAAAEEAEPKNDLDKEAAALPSKTVRETIRAHAGSLYQRALSSRPGIVSAIDRKLAESRVAEVSGRGSRVGVSGPDAPRITTRPVIREPVEAAQVFDEAAYKIAEDKISELFRELGNRISRREAAAVQRLHKELTAVRQSWCRALRLYSRDKALPRRQQLIDNILAEIPDFGDGWLCDCYLKILDGNEAMAHGSLQKAVELMSREPVRQIYCGQQILDAGNAALMLGDRKIAERLKNLLTKIAPNDPGVKLFKAMIYVDKSMFTDAVELLEDIMKDTSGLDRSIIAADYAWLKAAAPVDRLRDAKKAKAAVTDALAAGGGPHWKAWRADAALLASEAKWEEAIASIDKAVSQAPLLFEEELGRQRKSYLDHKEYFIERK